MRLRLLSLRVHTEVGLFAVSVRFGDGLTVLRGSNSIGKSMFLMSFLYGLGLEGMLTAKHIVPLPHAVTSYLEHDNKKLTVQSSDVVVLLANAEGELMTCQRKIAGPLSADEHNHLIRTWTGDQSDSLPSGSKDYFIRERGGATREAGFHHKLTQFLGWSLPTVPTFDGDSKPLYLETIFPLLFLEQKRGWLGLQARMPTHLRIREAQARAVEFLLALDEDRARVERTQLQSDIARLTEEWQKSVLACREVAHGARGEPSWLPHTTNDDWPEAEPTILMPEGDAWVSLYVRIQERASRLRALADTPVPMTGEIATAASARLERLERQLAEQTSLATRIDEELEIDVVDREAARTRADTLRRDLQRNKDVTRLRALGSLRTGHSRGSLPDMQSNHQRTRD
jgi:hypothetical protein